MMGDNLSRREGHKTESQVAKSTGGSKESGRLRMYSQCPSLCLMSTEEEEKDKETYKKKQERRAQERTAVGVGAAGLLIKGRRERTLGESGRRKGAEEKDHVSRGRVGEEGRGEGEGGYGADTTQTKSPT